MAMIWIFGIDERLRTTLTKGENEIVDERAGIYYDGWEDEEINGTHSLTFSVPADRPDSAHVIEGNLAMIEDRTGAYRLFEIVSLDEYHDEEGTLYKEAYCEDQGISELNDEAVIDVRPFSTTARNALERVLNGSRWRAGTVTVTKIAGMNGYYENTIKALASLQENFGGEYRFRVTFNETTGEITGRFVDLFDHRGTNRGKRFEWGKDIVSSQRTVSIDELKTRVYPRGRGEETGSGGFGRRTTIADVGWSKANGDPADKPLGQEWIGDEEARQRWGRPKDGVPGWSSGFPVWEDINDPNELIQLGWEYLQKVKNPRVTFGFKVADLSLIGEEYSHEFSNLGDTVVIIDDHFDPPVEVQARVIRLKRCLNDPTKTEVTCGNYYQEFSQVIRNIDQEIKKKVGVGDSVSLLDQTMLNLQDQFRSTLGFEYATPLLGRMWTNRPIEEKPDSVVQIKGGMIAISNEWDDVNDEPRFRFFANGNGITADEIRTGTLNADLVNVETYSGENSRLARIWNGAFYSYYDDSLSVVAGGYIVAFYDNGLYTPNPDYSYTGSISLAWYARSDDEPGDQSNRGIAIATEKDFVTIGHNKASEGGVRKLTSNLIFDYHAYSTGIYGPSKPSAETFSDLIIIDSRRRLDEENGSANGPRIRLMSGIKNSNKRVGDIEMIIGDGELTSESANFTIYKNLAMDSWEQVFRIQGRDDTAFLGPDGARLDWSPNSTDTNSAIRFGCDPYTYMYIGSTGRFHWRVWDGSGSNLVMTLESSGSGASLKVKDSSGTFRPVSLS
ncbi:phage tail spike protein [Salinithrix halophila]|uniref:Phage tail spike protein n=2 Tax=Salinithrix halophila TaxID=1485204 RepID=A0ABV8J8J4_9BACL